MSENTFEYYKKLFDKYRSEEDNNIDLVVLTKGLHKNFPKKPESRDYFYVCYAFWSRAAIPMEEDDRMYWAEKVKQAFRRVEDLAPEHQDSNRLSLLRMGWNAQLPSEDLYIHSG